MTPKSVLVPLLSGFEEIEAVTVIDVLRRADIVVIVASDQPGPVQGAHGIAVTATESLSEVSAADLAMIALPGGMPGAKHLAEHPEVQRLIREVHQAGGYTSAVCAAPMALAAAGVIGTRAATCYPGFESYLQEADRRSDRVVIDGTLVTSRGPGTALEFALTLVKLLRGGAAQRTLAEAMLVPAPA
jgi:protein deglycase